MVRNLTQSEDKIQQRRWNAARYAEEQEQQRISAIIQARDLIFSKCMNNFGTLVLRDNFT